MIVTLAVDDLDRAMGFYCDFLGVKSLALYPRKELAKDAGIVVSPSASSEFSIGRLVDSRQEVDNVLARAKLWEIIWNPE